MSDMTPISNMDLPDSVANAARDAFEELDGPLLYGYKAAIRAALQAMLDCGMAHYVAAFPGNRLTQATDARIIIRLDADEREQKEQP